MVYAALTKQPHNKRRAGVIVLIVLIGIKPLIVIIFKGAKRCQPELPARQGQYYAKFSSY